MAKPLSLCFDLTTMDGDDIVSVLKCLDAIYKDLGGDGLVIRSAEVTTRKDGHLHVTRHLDLEGLEVDKI